MNHFILFFSCLSHQDFIQILSWWSTQLWWNHAFLLFFVNWNTFEFLTKIKMIFYVFVVSDFFKYKAKNIFKSILFVWIHVTTDSFVSLIKDPLETSINFTTFIHRKRDRRHFKVNWKFVCFFLIFFGIFKKDKVVALSFNETNVTLGESKNKKIVTWCFWHHQ